MGIRLRLGAYLPLFPAGKLRDRCDVTLPEASGRSFWLNGSAWEYPTFENAETFVHRLEKAGLIALAPDLGNSTRGETRRPSLRARQRHFLQATGLSRAAVHQIERARRAAFLLRQGASIVDTVRLAGYYDQPHLTRSLKRFVGRSPVEIARGETQLSFLYKTERD